MTETMVEVGIRSLFTFSTNLETLDEEELRMTVRAVFVEMMSASSE